MLTQNNQRPRNSSDLLSRLVWVAGILLTGTVALGVGIVMTIASAQNNRAKVFEQGEAAEALDRRARDVANKVEAALAVDSGASSAPERLARRFGHHIVIVDADGATREINPSSDDAATREALTQRLMGWALLQDRGPGARAAATYGVVGGRFAFAAAVGLEAGGTLLAVDAAGIAEIAALDEMSAFDRLALDPGRAGDGRNALVFRDLTDGEIASLSWIGARPGDELISRIGWVAALPIVTTFLLFALVVINTRRVADDLAASHERVASLAVRDALSGLPNRVLFGERLDEALGRLRAGAAAGLAVMFLDLDRFKEVNDAHGHQAGDELIKQVAERLLRTLREGDTLARFGGDEFAVIAASVDDEEGARDLSSEILHALSAPFDIFGSTVNIGVSIGIALAPRDAAERDDLMRLADTALYEAKSEGRNRAIQYRPQMDAEIQMRKVVSDDLRLAIANDELTVHYQPIYSAAGDRIVCLEALVRWPHPAKGMIPPDAFIPLAEQSGLVIPLGEWVMRRVCRDGMRWPGVRLAVNVSPIQFRQRDFVDSVLAVVEEVGFDPSRLEIELTEGVVVEDADAAEAAMRRLRDQGFHLALDDFGTGYSSLIYLRRFAFDKIKIDRSFLESLEGVGESAILVHSIVHLGRALGMTVTAEGVETKEQHRFLQALGCHELQGFLFSRPVVAEEIDAMLGVAPRRGARVSAA